MISSHFYPTNPVTQSQIVTYIFDSSLPNSTGTPAQTILGIYYATNNTQLYQSTLSPLSFGDIENNVGNGYPVVANVWAHAVCIYQTLSILNTYFYVTLADPDPAYNMIYTTSYSTFLDGSWCPPASRPYVANIHKR